MNHNHSLSEQRDAFMNNCGVACLQAKAAGGVPEGLELPPDVLRGMADSVASMSPDDLQGMMSAMEAARTGDGSQSFAAPSSSTPPGPQQMQQAAAALQVSLNVGFECMAAVEVLK